MIKRIILTILPLKPRESEREREGKNERIKYGKRMRTLFKENGRTV